MKKFINKLIVLALVSFGIMSCSKDTLTVLNPSASTTVSVSANEVVLDILNTGQQALKIDWTKPDFGYNAAPSYNIVFTYGDKTYEVSAGTDLSKTFETEELNKILITKLGLTPKVSDVVSIKIKVVLSDYKSIDSDAVSITFTPYSTTFEPIYMIGDAVLGWDTAKAVTTYGTGPGTYEVVAEFNNGGAFRFFSAPDWNATSQYNWTFFEGGSVDANLQNANDGDTNIRFIGNTGYYKIDVNLITKTIVMTSVQKPTMYMVGAGVPDAGWGWNTPVQMTWVSDGIFSVTTNFINDTFRFFPIFGDWNSGLNYPYYIGAGYTIDSHFENALDGDSNFRFIGTPGSYKITLNNHTKMITLE